MSKAKSKKTSAAAQAAADEAVKDAAWEAAAEAAEQSREQSEQEPASSDSLASSGGAVPDSNNGARVSAGEPVEQSQAGTGSLINPSADPGTMLVAEGDGGEVVYPESAQMAARDDADAYRAMSAADERQIAQELEGKAVKAMLYSFRQQGKDVIGFSWKGVREAIRQVNTRGFGRIALDPSNRPEFEQTTLQAEIGQKGGEPVYGEVPAIQCTVYAHDAMHGTGQWGTAIQTRDQVVKSKADPDTGLYLWRPDPFSRTKALNKAQRNALEPFIPLELVEQLKVQYMGRGQVEYIDSTATEINALPPALTDQRAQDQQARCRELYAEIKRKHGPKLLTPGRFNAFMVAAQHSHERLDDCIAHLTDLLETGGGGG